MKEIEVKEVIISSIATRGDGKFTPIRRVVQVFEKNGTLIAENDCMAPREIDLINFARWARENASVGEIGNEHINAWRREGLIQK